MPEVPADVYVAAPAAHHVAVGTNERELEVLDADDETLEVILADAPQDAQTLIEDEVLLARLRRVANVRNARESAAVVDPEAPRTSAFGVGRSQARRRRAGGGFAAKIEAEQGRN
jgi:hypothetical protein